MYGYQTNNGMAQQQSPAPLPVKLPQTKEEFQQLLTRWQTLKQELGDAAGQNSEFIELSKVIQELKNRRAQAHAHAQAQQQQQQAQAQAQAQAAQAQAQAAQAQAQRQQAQAQAQARQAQQQMPPQQHQFPPQVPQHDTSMSPAPQAHVQQQQQQQQQQQRAQSPQVNRSPNSRGTLSLSQEQTVTFKCQMAIFKALSMGSQPPQNALAQLYPDLYSAQPSGSPGMSSMGQTPVAIGQQAGSPVVRPHSRTPSVSSPHSQHPQAPPPPPQQPLQQHQHQQQHQQQQQQPSQQVVQQAPVTPIPVPSEPKTNEQKLGTVEAIDPWDNLGNETPFEKLTARQTQVFVPSIMPTGLDAVAIKEKRERDVSNQMGERINELIKYEQQEPTEENIDKLIELKSLRLVNYNKAVKGDLLSQIYYFNSVGVDDTNRAQQYIRMRRPEMLDAMTTEQFEKDQQHQRMAKENQKRTEHLSKIKTHCDQMILAGRQRVARYHRMGKVVNNFHSFTEKEEQKRVERTAKQRLQALRANDEEAYIKLLDQTKDTRITHLLKQTNTFLGSLAEAVKSQQEDATRDDPIQEQQAGEEQDDEKTDYYKVAHRVHEEVSKQPDILVGGTLKEYQVKGLQWMVSLYNNNLNGILADEMGLGKTIQTISLITYLIEKKNIPGPYLVIVPLSTLTNWTLEFEKWAPSVKKVVYKGPPMARKAQQQAIREGDFKVLLTTYEYIIKDRPVLSRIRWVHMIIDEGHRMKNVNSKLSYTLTAYYSSKFRLILTGTPLQNNLPELWALLNFALPKVFNSVKSFDEWFNTPFANTGSQDRMELSEEETLLIIRRLHKVLRPFLLRRLKKDVEKDLPDKVEKVIKCKMSALQSKLYQQMVKHRMLFLGEGVKGAASGVKGLNNSIMQLRKICNHPYVFEEVENLVNPNKINGDDLWRAAGKFELLDRILPKFKSTGHRVLMFFQMTQIMDIMEDYLRYRGLQYLRLDGGTKADERSDLLKLFNAPDSPYFAFLLSTRAGGLGLNLQSADTVIIYDTDWNPHQDLQAQDRAHRIGQTKEVRILRLITEDSVEENILERAHAKLEIDGKVIQAGKFDNKSTNEEQEAFLRSLLEAEEAKRGQKEDEDEDLDDEELNDILARSEEERELFRKADQDRVANDTFKGRRLMVLDELPGIYKKEIHEVLKKEPVESYGRGARERKIMHYDDGLTEEQWLDAVDNDEDSIEDAIARKRARQTKRKKEDESPPPLPESPPPPPAKKKRGRKPKSEIANGPLPLPLPTAAAAPSSATAAASTTTTTGAAAVAVIDPLAPPRKKAKGRPPKIKETLTPEQRQDLTAKMRAVFDNVMSVYDHELNRPRNELFLELPSKKLYPDYYMLIKSPIACDMIQKRINNNTYQVIDAFINDLTTMFINARTYNEEGSIVYEDANALQRAMNDKLAEVAPGKQQAPPLAAPGPAPGPAPAPVDSVDPPFMAAPAAEPPAAGPVEQNPASEGLNEHEIDLGLTLGGDDDFEPDQHDDLMNDF